MQRHRQMGEVIKESTLDGTCTILINAKCHDSKTCGQLLGRNFGLSFFSFFFIFDQDMCSHTRGMVMIKFLGNSYLLGNQAQCYRAMGDFNWLACNLKPCCFNSCTNPEIRRLGLQVAVRVWMLGLMSESCFTSLRIYL